MSFGRHRIHGVRGLAVLAILAAAGCLYGTSRAALFPAETAGTSISQDNGTSIVAQAAGRVYVVGQNTAAGKARFSTNAYDEPWTELALCGEGDGDGSHGAMVIDSRGALHAVYSHDAGTRTLFYASDASGQWLTRQVAGNAATGASIAVRMVSGVARVHVAWMNADNSRLNYATNASGQWVTTALDTITANSDAGTSIAVAANGKVYIGYVADSRANYVTNVSGSWQSHVLEDVEAVSFAPRLAIDADTNLHAAYLVSTGGANRELRYASDISGAWQTELVAGIDTALRFTASLAVDADGHATVAWYEATSSNLSVATNAGGAWAAQVIDALPAGIGSVSLCTDAVGSAYACYVDGSGNLLYATNSAAEPSGADVRVEIEASDQDVLSDEVVTFTATVRNLGPEDATQVVLEVSVPAGASNPVASNSGVFISAEGVYRWTIANLAAGQEVTRTLTVHAPLTSGVMTSTAVVEAGDDNFRLNNDTGADSVAVTGVHYPLVIQSLTTGGRIVSPTSGTFFAEGEIVTVRVEPDPGHHVAGWSGTQNDASTANTNTVVMRHGQGTTVSVRFEADAAQWNLTTAVVGGHGTLKPAGGTFSDGTIVTLTAKPDIHYAVEKWTGTNNDSSTATTNTVTMDANRSVTVKFVEVPNEPPHSSPAADPSPAESGDLVTLDGSDSYDPEGGPLVYEWKQIAGPDVALSGTYDEDITFTAPRVGGLFPTTLVFELTVTDDMGAKDTNPVEVRVSRSGPTTICGNGVAPAAVLCIGGLAFMKCRSRITRRR